VQRRARNPIEEVSFVLMQIVVMSTDSHSGTAGLPLPNRERVGVRGNKSLDSS